MEITPIDTYIADIENPSERIALENLRKILHELLPDATECISYGMPAFRIGKDCVAGFSKFQNHLSFFPFSGTLFEYFPDEIQDWKHTKSSLHFTPEKPIPKEFLGKMMQKRLESL